MNQLPKFHETFNAILETLSEGKTIASHELELLVRDNYFSKLPYELLNQKISSGDNLLLNRIAWGKSYLKLGGFLYYPKRGFVAITDKGKITFKKGGINIEQLKKDVDFLAHQGKKQAKKSNNNFLNQDNDINDLSPKELIDEGINNIKNEIQIELLDRLKNIDPFYFERIILYLFKKMGYGDVIETKKTGDGGIDGIINEDKLGLDKIYIQAKRYSDNKVNETAIRDFIGAMSGDTDKGIFVTTSFFSESAINKARSAHHKIILIDGEKLVDLMYTYSVGLEVKEIYEVKGFDEDFFNNN